MQRSKVRKIKLTNIKNKPSKQILQVLCGGHRRGESYKPPKRSNENQLSGLPGPNKPHPVKSGIRCANYHPPEMWSRGQEHFQEGLPCGGC